MLNPKKKNLHWCDLDMATIDLTKLICHFSHANKAEGKSPKTDSFYTEMLQVYVKFLSLKGKTAELAQLNANMVREFIIHQQSRGLSPFTVQCRVRALKAFASWLLTEGYTEYNVLATIKLPKAPQKIIQPLTSEEIEKLINSQDPLSATGCRDIAILTALLATGVRLSELSDLHFNDAHIEDGYLKVNGKGNKERVVPIGVTAQKMLYRYIFHFRPEPATPEDDYLFLTLDGRHLSSNAIKLIIARWGKRAGVPRLHAHLCRHTFATTYLVHQIGDIFSLKLILGHTTLQMVDKYVHYSSSHDLIKKKSFSPLDHLNIKKLTGYKVDKQLKSMKSSSKH